MALPSQIEDRLAALGTSVAEVEERFVRGAGPGGRTIEIIRWIPTDLLSGSEPNLMNTAIETRLVALGTRGSDVEERFVIGSGRGGQKLQKTSSCVWLRHRPTGIEVRCQRERSQAANRELAWAELCAKLDERERAAAAIRQNEREKTRRQNRQKSRGQKQRMIEAKKRRAKTKAHRGQVGLE